MAANSELSGAQADFYGGTVHGSFRAQLVALPWYEVESSFSQVNLDLAQWSESGSWPTNSKGWRPATCFIRAGGTAVRRCSILWSAAASREVGKPMRGVSIWRNPLRQGEAEPGATLMPQLDAAFTCQAHKVQFSRLRFSLGVSARTMSASWQRRF